MKPTIRTAVIRYIVLRSSADRTAVRVYSALVVAVAFLLACSALRAEPARADSVVRETVIVGVRVGDRRVPEQEWGDIVIAQDDSLFIEYRCRVSNRQFDAKLFEITLKSGDGSAFTDAVRSPSLVWTRLQEKAYTFVVQAFAPGRWRATPTAVDFRVDNAEAARRRRAREEREKQTAAAAAVPDSVTTSPGRQSGSLMEWGVYVLAGIGVAAGIGAVLFQSIRQRRRMSKQAAVQDIPESQSEQDSIHSSAAMKDSDMVNQTLSYEQLQKENSALRAEIAALRGQIEALQVRTDELQKTNKELAGQKERLLEHKRQLEELQSQKDELFSMVVHDIKNPAGLIRGLVELLRSYDLTAQEQQEIMEDLMATSTRILALAQEVSRIVTLESGELRLDFNRYPMGRIIEDVCRRNQAAAVKKQIDIQRDTSSILPDVEIDVQKVEEVLDNLVSNAIKFSNNGSLVKVKTYKSGENIVVEVIDNGPGLTEADIKRAFGRGARLSAKPTGGESSSGLGLWIVKKIVEAHHGRVWVKSSILKGSTFAFELPISQPISDGTHVH